MGDEELEEVSRSVLVAESWLRGNVLAHYPATEITTIVVGDTILCNKYPVKNKLALLLPSVKNIYHSLTRWGLQNEIRVSVAFSSSCFQKDSTLLRDDLAKKFVKPLFEFLWSTNSTYSLDPSPKLSPLSAETLTEIQSVVTEKLGFFELKNINLVVKISKERKPMNRKLSFVEFSVPSNIALSPNPPQPHRASPPPLSFPTAPESAPPFVVPAAAPAGFTWPPCSPPSGGATAGEPAPAPQIHVMQKLWCVAKPSVPEETLQEALDFACGEGGADCGEIMPNGNCYYPDTVVAHASYAFNSYWQKNKRNGGTCNFGGTAMLINSDPSNSFF